MCSSKQPSLPSVPQAPPPPVSAKNNAEELEKARQDEQAKLRGLTGRSSTLLTGGQGLVDEAPTTKKTLLG